MDRCERIDLEEYDYSQLGQIVQRTLPSVKFASGLLEEIATVLRGNARAAQKMANNIAVALRAAGKKTFSKDDWADIKFNLGIAPLGLSPIEIRVLEILNERKECSLTHLAAKTQLTKACLQRDFEMYLQKMNLMQITTAGRAITKEGKDYLDNLPNEEQPKKVVHKAVAVEKKKKPVRINLDNVDTKGQIGNQIIFRN
tara:strand:+ start:9363 stop:9959 length:597 start_codon:yes stop_codon:yes gene_type:complete